MHAYERISRYKGALMGISILVVVYGHLLYYHSGLLDYTQLGISEWYTIGSVDAFLFLSGFGIYHSLKKNAETLPFMQRRLGRLLPSYLPFIVVFCAFMMWAGQMDKWQALGNLTTFGWWTQMGAQFNWYIPTLIALYLFSPLLFGLIERYQKKALLLFPLLFLLDAACVDTSLMIGVSRFPVYFLGMYLGSEAAKGKQPSRRHLILSGVLLVGSMAAFYFLVTRHPGSLKRYGFWWHPFLLATPGCLYFLTWVLHKMERWGVTRAVSRILSFLGGASFEIYLCHIFVYTVALYFGLKGWGKWILMAFVGIAVGIGYQKLVNLFTERRTKNA